MTRIVCAQLAPRLGDLAGNQALTVAAVRRAADGGARVVVLPELATSGYVFETSEQARRVAVTPEHPLFARWASAARGAVVVGGFCELGADGHLYNSAAVVDRTGVLAVYRKTHLWDREKTVFTPGRDQPPVVRTQAGRIGVLICYDLEFPEMPRSMVLRGADLIAAPVNWPLVPRPAGERAPEIVLAMAAARANRVFVACCDRSGVERGVRWTEGTAVISHEGWVLGEPDADGVAAADIDLELARDKSLTAHADLLADRRPEMYSALTSATVHTGTVPHACAWSPRSR
ncbi:Predicted amidohydrolase [Amycolatopsis marina]|uniref:Predicted amidohydrolase n=1 Tax=Amycolatopsis marina TaxID=490629 RepID=A0A1I1C529_9PSEU|nr:nitrilase-related carbon-nitrogen hydrolase [Amycolatopsis marina]SFB56018.1 Predicted amidohydrolase [Amycolatopsis marina]